jgi:ADP-heptose:LPS heptosyltransferase
MGRSCVVIRTGAFGDALMASAVFPGLVAQGYRLTFVTSWEGEEMCRHDPYLGGRIRVMARGQQEKDWPPVWQALEAEFDHVVNLVNGMECSLLRHPSQFSYFWPAETRRQMSAGSYLTQYLRQAGVEGPARIRFVPSVEEREWVPEKRREIGPYVVWALSGSAPHKVYPHLPQAVVQVLTQTDLAVVLSGAIGDRELERVVYDAVIAFAPSALPRLHSWVGDGSLRRSMALAQSAVAVIGPETAMPMSVAHEPQVHKVVLLSHSAASNLTDDWTNTTALIGSVPCYPCHRLHYDFTHCVQDQVSGAAACAAAIRPEVIADAVMRASAKTLAVA